MQDAGVHNQLANVGIKCLWSMSPGAPRVGPIFRNTNLIALTTTLQQFSIKRTSDYECRKNHGASVSSTHTFGPASPAGGRVSGGSVSARQHEDQHWATKLLFNVSLLTYAVIRRPAYLPHLNTTTAMTSYSACETVW